MSGNSGAGRCLLNGRPLDPSLDAKAKSVVVDHVRNDRHQKFPFNYLTFLFPFPSLFFLSLSFYALNSDRGPGKRVDVAIVAGSKKKAEGLLLQPEQLSSCDSLEN